MSEKIHFDGMIAISKPMMELFDKAKRVARTDYPILIQGQSGTGKERLARAIHQLSERADRPFIIVDCGAIPENLLESELFGHEKGSFTGAHARQIGKLERAQGGTLVLDEIGELPLQLQVKLLRFLQEKKFERIGGTRTIQVDVGIIAATNKDLEKAVACGEFREDLYYRLNVIPIRVPPLRERDGDVPLLVHHFLRRHCREKEIPLKKLSKTAAAALDQYAWPGNVRELENLIERLVILTDSDEIGIEDLPPRIRQQQFQKPVSRPFPELTEEGMDLKKTLDELEDRLILDALKMAGGVKNKAAQLLGLNRTTLIEKMKKKKILYPA